MTTTRVELIELAKKHAVPGSKEIVTAIVEAHQQLNLATHQLLIRSESADFFKRQENYNVAGSFVAEANSYDVAAAKLNTLFLTLACLLQNNGIAVEY